MTALLKLQCNKARTCPCLIYRAVLIRTFLAVDTHFFFWQFMNYLVLSKKFMSYKVSKYANTDFAALFCFICQSSNKMGYTKLEVVLLFFFVLIVWIGTILLCEMNNRMLQWEKVFHLFLLLYNLLPRC